MKPQQQLNRYHKAFKEQEISPLGPAAKKDGEVIKLNPAAIPDSHLQPAIVVHCKAGKGRTGTMICALLVFLNQFKNDAESITHYNRQRAKNEKALTIASQYRYVKYMTGLLYLHLADKGRLDPGHSWLYKSLVNYSSHDSWITEIDKMYK